VLAAVLPLLSELDVAAGIYNPVSAAAIAALIAIDLHECESMKAYCWSAR
jgi:hypothetical protein